MLTEQQAAERAQCLAISTAAAKPLAKRLALYQVAGQVLGALIEVRRLPDPELVDLAAKLAKQLWRATEGP